MRSPSTSPPIRTSDPVDEAWIKSVLEDLRHHWGSAYMIDCAGQGRWMARRRDNGDGLTAESADELGDLIQADYLARPVPR